MSDTRTSKAHRRWLRRTLIVWRGASCWRCHRKTPELCLRYKVPTPASPTVRPDEAELLCPGCVRRRDIEFSNSPWLRAKKARDRAEGRLRQTEPQRWLDDGGPDIESLLTRAGP